MVRTLNPLYFIDVRASDDPEWIGPGPVIHLSDHSGNHPTDRHPQLIGDGPVLFLAEHSPLDEEPPSLLEGLWVVRPEVHPFVQIPQTLVKRIQASRLIVEANDASAWAEKRRREAAKHGKPYRPPIAFLPRILFSDIDRIPMDKRPDPELIDDLKNLAEQHRKRWEKSIQKDWMRIERLRNPSRSERAQAFGREVEDHILKVMHEDLGFGEEIFRPPPQATPRDIDPTEAGPEFPAIFRSKNFKTYAKEMNDRLVAAGLPPFRIAPDLPRSFWKRLGSAPRLRHVEFLIAYHTGRCKHHRLNEIVFRTLKSILSDFAGASKLTLFGLEGDRFVPTERQLQILRVLRNGRLKTQSIADELKIDRRNLNRKGDRPGMLRELADWGYIKILPRRAGCEITALGLQLLAEEERASFPQDSQSSDVLRENVSPNTIPSTKPAKRPKKAPRKGPKGSRKGPKASKKGPN